MGQPWARHGCRSERSPDARRRPGIGGAGSVCVVRRHRACAEGNGILFLRRRAGNVSIAHGSGASAVAGLTDGDERNRAKALSDDAIAVAGEGNGNAATASGGAVGAVATNGDNNSATASGTNGAAVANFGSDNRVRVSGDDSAAVVAGGNRNTITVSSDNCAVAVTFGDDIRDTC
ncbi:hypothetical protein [Pseudonocardia sp. NPDC049154]|uniref:hypothetical protein n=1 Tax=Pseudonocardia sp. NPDC049154 TaxID=3155501 RepID=UPI0033E37773